MSENDLQGEYATLRPKTAASVGGLLARYGAPFDSYLNEMLHWTRAQLPDLPEFSVWMAEALAWARFAKRDDAFFAAAAGFIDEGDPALLDAATQFPDRFGPERLRDALAAYRCWYEEMETVLRDVEPEPVRWKAVQEKSLRVAERLKQRGAFRQVGLWLFPAPFKIMAVAHAETWQEQALDAVVMPTGTQVVRALRILNSDRVVKIDNKVLGASERTFADEYTNLWTLQLPQKHLASAGKTSLLHINGALHALGER